MVEAEARPPVGLLQQVLQQAGEVDEGVAQQEEHRDDGRHAVDVARSDAGRTDEYCERERPAGLAGPLEGAQDRDEVVVGDGLQEARRASERLQPGAWLGLGLG